MLSEHLDMVIVGHLSRDIIVVDGGRQEAICFLIPAIESGRYSLYSALTSNIMYPSKAGSRLRISKIGIEPMPGGR